MAKLVTVFGASGFLGRHVVRELAKRGHRVRAAVRHPHQAVFLQPMGVVGQIHLFQSNIRYRHSVADALAGADACVNLVGILAPKGKQKFDTVQAKGAEFVAEECAREGITNLVHVSAIGADKDSDSDYARTKGEGEEAVRRNVPAASIVRPSIVFGPQDEFFNKFAAMARISPVLPLIGGGKTRFQPVYVDDVADAIVKLIDGEAPAGEIYELGGPEILTFKECLELMLKIIDRRRLLVPVPWPVAEAMGAAGSLASRLPFVEAPITADQVKLLRKDNVVGEGVKTFADLGIEPETLDAILPTYLFRYRKHGQFSPEVPV
ncbi:complex I NDUFA9 subunit family protein [Parvularcula lutaonensis]|uniref:Complex I NDUFA9 subunit family protein n=1 Tax=Parvularcula lutaonensis TaxID=491923 RepID=A0ABV7MAD8_9PROT|nr:complex I NDUFA9 subunit family protein [Parvularcula lutaonensis]GGY45378.1 3-beta-hydroxy-Delta(5)-steroid dehydrogenase [Parvularcula lutaonensis]